MWIVRNGNSKIEVDTPTEEEAISTVLENETEHLGLFLEVYKPGQAWGDRLSVFVPTELLKRHMIKNRDVVKLMNDLGLDLGGDIFLGLMRDNARWWKEHPEIDQG